MILIAIGSNLASARGGPCATCEAALDRLQALGVKAVAVSPWYETAPVPASDQPWFVNGAAVVETTPPPEDLLALLHQVESEFGRSRTVANAARILDLDLLAYGRVVRSGPLDLPHPRLHERAFVLYPLRDVAPDWLHPTLGQRPAALIAALPPGQLIRPLTPRALTLEIPAKPA